ncbi:DUF2948 family protein [Prosthecomicrobium sp. N25]|uniref:DUF2948 family protein n=1 Tax=Prosthecomicrobium sp. N25 TaxID=3129254 RepID=UPI003077C9BE
MKTLKLMALDAEDLKVVSACIQDAVLKVGDLRWQARDKRFVVAMNRLAWEEQPETGTCQRRRACLHFDRVLSVKSSGVPKDRPGEVLCLLAVTFSETDAPAGMVDLVFAGGGAIRLTVECLEAQLADLGAAWAARLPAHEV